MVRDAFLGLVWAESAPKFWGSLERKQYFFMNKFPEGGGQLVFIILLFFLTKKQKKILKSLGGGRGVSPFTNIFINFKEQAVASYLFQVGVSTSRAL